jgi:hypothetical protein
MTLRPRQQPARCPGWNWAAHLEVARVVWRGEEGGSIEFLFGRSAVFMQMHVAGKRRLPLVSDKRGAFAGSKAVVQLKSAP